MQRMARVEGGDGRNLALKAWVSTSETSRSPSRSQEPRDDGSEASTENTAGMALKELVAERDGLSANLGRHGAPAGWILSHMAFNDIEVEPPEMLALNDFVTISQRHEGRHDRARSMNFERRSGCSSNIWAEATTQPSTWSPDQIRWRTDCMVPMPKNTRTTRDLSGPRFSTSCLRLPRAGSQEKSRLAPRRRRRSCSPFSSRRCARNRSALQPSSQTLRRPSAAFSRESRWAACYQCNEGVSERVRRVLRKLLAEDEVITAQGLEPLWRRAAQDRLIGCSFGVKVKEGRTVLWSGTRPGDTMADLIFCLAFLRFQVSLEERLAQHGIASTTASARKGIFGGQHDKDLTSLFSPTFT